MSSSNKQSISQFFQLLADLQKKGEMELFLKSFLTDSELQILSKRLAIVKLLAEKKSYEDIRQELQVSSATIASVAEQMESTGLQLGLRKIAFDRQLSVILRKLGV